MPLTQEDIDKWMPYILEKMETKFLTSNQFIPYKKKVLEVDAIIKDWTPMLTTQVKQINKISEQIKPNYFKKPFSSSSFLFT